MEGGLTLLCHSGCAVCSYTNKTLACSFPLDGYALNSNNKPIKCSSKCLTCNGNSP